MLAHERFKDRVVLVTGGNTGIGRQIAMAFIRAGARTFINYIQAGEELERIYEASRSCSGRVEGLYADIAQEDACRKMVNDIVDKAGRLDILVNNAAILRQGLMTTMPDEEWLAVLRVNLSGQFYCSKWALASMKKNNFGRIINLGSCLAVKAQEGVSSYAVSKAALIGLTRALAREVEQFDITVNILLPGGVEDTGMLHTFKGSFQKKFFETIGSSRLLKTEEIVNQLLLLCDEASRATNGQTIALGSGFYL